MCTEGQDGGALQSVTKLATLITKTAIRENQNEKDSLTTNPKGIKSQEFKTPEPAARLLQLPTPS